MGAVELNGLKAAVFCAAEGVGPATVAALVEAGADVAVDMVVSEFDAAVTVVGMTGRATAFLDACETALGPLDILVISAPPVRNKPLFDIGADEMREVIEGDLVMPALLMQEAARRMARRGMGRIIVFASMSAKTGAHHNVAPFAAAKGGLLAFVRAAASEVAEHGVTVNGIATSLFEPQVARMSEEKREALKRGGGSR